MKADLKQIDAMLRQVAVPAIEADPARRARLRAALMAEAAGRRLARPRLVRRIWSSRWGRVAAAILVAAALTTAGWAAQKVYKALFRPKTTEYRRVDVRPTTQHRVGGQVFTSMLAGAQVVKGEEDEDLPEIRRLFAAKKYRALGPVEVPGKPLRHMYSFDLADGRQVRRAFSVRLEEAGSWEELEKKQEEVEAAWTKAYLAEEPRRMRRIDEAVKAGRFRKVNALVFQTHECRDAETGRKFDVQYTKKLDGREFATTHDKKFERMWSMKWEDHLKLIAEGRRELVGVRTRTVYIYEITLEDGTKTLFAGEPDLGKAATTKDAGGH